MSEITEQKPMDIAAFTLKFTEMEIMAEALRVQIESGCAVMARQTEMLNVALDVLIAVVGDETVDMRIRRRLGFALQQIKGIGLPS